MLNDIYGWCILVRILLSNESKSMQKISTQKIYTPYNLEYQKFRILFSLAANNRKRRPSEDSIQSGVVDAQQLHTINILKPKWWGGRRIDYALYCPEGLSNFPTNSLPHLFHSSYWESADVIRYSFKHIEKKSLEEAILTTTKVVIFLS